MQFIFQSVLVEGVIERRKGQFTMLVNHNGSVYRCHCPTTGRIGSLDLMGRPCLMSRSLAPERKTAFTVEAISLSEPSDNSKSWIGINQNAINRYVEYFLINGAFSDMVEAKHVYREQKLGTSRLDFLIGDTYIEVKMPLQYLQIEIPSHIKEKKSGPFKSTDRMTRHITELGNSLKTNERAIMLLCFVYDNPGFEVVERSTTYEKVKKIVDENVSKGVEIWQANFRLDSVGISLEKYFKIRLE